MTKILGPLFSIDALGTFARAVTYGSNQFGNWARRIVRRKYTRNEDQNFIRSWFKWGIDVFKGMSQEERFLWELALTNYVEHGSSTARNLHRWARCLFLHHVLTTFSFEWNGSPFPLELWQMLASDQIEGYSQIMSDLETLTAFSFCEEVKPYFFKYLGVIRTPGHPGKGLPSAGMACYSGTAIALNEKMYKDSSDYVKKFVIAHELTHSIMNQHGWDYGATVAVSEQIANECGARVANGELTPVYLYEGKALPELVDNPECP